MMLDEAGMLKETGSVLTWDGAKEDSKDIVVSGNC